MRWDASSGIEPLVSRVVDGLSGLRVPERIDRRVERSERLGRAPHVECALRVRAVRRGRPLARTTTRTPAWRPWSSHESRGSRGVGVHQSCREGPDWPVLPRPSLDASLNSPTATRRFLCPAVRGGAPALLVSERSLGHRTCCPAPLRRPARAAPGAPGQEESRERSHPTPSTVGVQAYCVR